MGPGMGSLGGQSPALVARVNEKKAELENLKELRDLSAAVASQMEALEQKLATLSDGTEGRLGLDYLLLALEVTDHRSKLSPWSSPTGIMC